MDGIEELPSPDQCRRCSDCLGSDHHWMESSLVVIHPDEPESMEPIDVCKHCTAIRFAWCDGCESSPCRCG